jgi:hypothetical protein
MAAKEQRESRVHLIAPLPCLIRNSQARAGRSVFEEPAPPQRPPDQVRGRREAASKASPRHDEGDDSRKRHTDALSRRGGARYDLNRWERSVGRGVDLYPHVLRRQLLHRNHATLR